MSLLRENDEAPTAEAVPGEEPDYRAMYLAAGVKIVALAVFGVTTAGTAIALGSMHPIIALGIALVAGVVVGYAAMVGIAVFLMEVVL